MEQGKRAVRLWTIWALTLLLIALLTYLGALATVATGYGPYLFFLAALLVVAGVCVAIGAIAAGSRVVDRSQRAALLWSLWSLALLLAALAILLSYFGILATPGCRAGCLGSIAYAGFTLLLTTLLGGASVLVGIGAGVAGVVSAAKSARPGWFVALLAYLLGSLISAVAVYLLVGQGVLSVDSPLAVFFASPLLIPVVTMAYSLSGRQKGARTLDSSVTPSSRA